MIITMVFAFGLLLGGFVSWWITNICYQHYMEREVERLKSLYGKSDCELCGEKDKLILSLQVEIDRLKKRGVTHD